VERAERRHADPLSEVVTDIGKLLLAGRPELAASGPLRQVTPYTTATPGALAAELDRIRRTAVASEVDECRVGRSAIAVPVHTVDGSLVGAVAAIGKTGRLTVTDREVIEKLRHTADRLRMRTPRRTYRALLDPH
jgi:DNA-binding IclR family transcriptional regulator